MTRPLDVVVVGPIDFPHALLAGGIVVAGLVGFLLIILWAERGDR